MKAALKFGRLLSYGERPYMDSSRIARDSGPDIRRARIFGLRISDAVVDSLNSLNTLAFINVYEKHSGDSRDQKECLLPATSGRSGDCALFATQDNGRNGQGLRDCGARASYHPA